VGFAKTLQPRVDDAVANREGGSHEPIMRARVLRRPADRVNQLCMNRLSKRRHIVGHRRWRGLLPFQSLHVVRTFLIDAEQGSEIRTILCNGRTTFARERRSECLNISMRRQLFKVHRQAPHPVAIFRYSTRHVDLIDHAEDVFYRNR